MPTNEENIATSSGQQSESESAFPDYATAVEDELLNLLLKDSSVRNKRNKTLDSFPVVLHEVLSEVENYGMEKIISWQPHGRCFLVHDEDGFVQNILQFWFRQTKFASFHRQLNTYGFRRIKMGIDKGAFFHEMFLRGKPFLCHRIQRGETKKRDQGVDPNFYDMKFLPPTRRKAPPNLSNACHPKDDIVDLQSKQPSLPTAKIQTNFLGRNLTINCPPISHVPNQLASQSEPCALFQAMVGADSLRIEPLRIEERSSQANVAAIQITSEHIDTSIAHQSSIPIPTAKVAPMTAPIDSNTMSLLRPSMLNHENLLSDAHVNLSPFLSNNAESMKPGSEV